MIQWEGYKTEPYVCPTGHLTVGIGHKLLKHEIKDSYTKEEIEVFFKHDIQVAIDAAKKNFKDFESHPKQAKLVIISLIYSVGQNGIKRFVKFKTAIDNKDYKTAAKELKNSKWFTQVGRNRATNHYNMLYLTS